jgi:hypothetical protein
VPGIAIAIVIGVAVLLLAVLFVAGAPVSGLVPVAAFAVCLTMYLVMGHGGIRK